MPEPALIFDGDCGFCRYWVGRWGVRAGDRVTFLPFQDPEVARRFPQVSIARAREAVQFVDSRGEVSEGAGAVFRLTAATGLHWPLRFYEALPPFAAAAEFAYRIVARHRPLFSRLTLALWGRGAAPSTYACSTWLLLRLLGVAYLCAFWSMGVQVRGLIGRDGIMPVSSFLGVAVTDPVLVGICVAGCLLAVVLIAGVGSVGVLPALWALYLSLSAMSGDFLSFQWDALLLETGLLAIFVAPLAWYERPGRDEPRTGARWLIWWLLFRLMLGSGIVKLASGDPTWRSWTALLFHYETQPIPTPLAWYAHQLPSAVQRASTATVLAIELLMPWLIFAPRRPRAVAAASFVALQVLIALTGNYAFFNLLTIALALTLLDDAQLRAWPPDVPSRRWPRPIIAAVAVLTVPLSFVILASQARVRVPGGRLLVPLYRVLAPLRSVNGYGLFAAMTTTRPEISIEGSDDGLSWKAYTFRYKPGPLDRRPPWVAPHQPRLDWQMWFAALGEPETEPWFEPFCRRLLEGSPPVLRLLADNPFPRRPPAFVRGVLYDYRFADRDTHRRDGAWWARDRLGEYSPVFQATPPIHR